MLDAIQTLSLNGLMVQRYFKFITAGSKVIFIKKRDYGLTLNSPMPDVMLYIIQQWTVKE